MKKTILISIDGMRPDGFLQCGSPFADKMMEIGSYTLDARTAFPSVTLPCHMTMFYSVPPERHGITTNIYIPFARPLPSLFDQIAAMKGISAMYYGWQPMRDVSAPKTLHYSSFIQCTTGDHVDDELTDLALDRIARSHPDFVYLYLVDTDKDGHGSGWMTDKYLDTVRRAIENVRRVYEAAGDEYTIVVTADHGGHDRGHGTTMPEDMTIPMFFIGERFTPGKKLDGVTMLDITPTIADVMEILPADEWEGKSLANGK